MKADTASRKAIAAYKERLNMLNKVTEKIKLEETFVIRPN